MSNREYLKKLDRPCPGRHITNCSKMCASGCGNCRDCEKKRADVRFSREGRLCPGPGTGIRCGRLARKGKGNCAECSTERARNCREREDRPCPGLRGVQCGQMCVKGRSYCAPHNKESKTAWVAREGRSCPGPNTGVQCGRFAIKGSARCAECDKQYFDVYLAKEDRPCPGPSARSGAEPCGRMLPKGRNCCIECSRERMLLTKFGMSTADYEAMEKAQGGRCSICMNPPPNAHPFRLAVDHDPKTGMAGGKVKVRELLCTPCNTSLGGFKDSPELLDRAAAYLRKHSAQVASGSFLPGAAPRCQVSTETKLPEAFNEFIGVY